MVKPTAAVVFALTLFAFSPLFAQDEPGPPSQVMPCVACHGADGKGKAPLFPNLACQSAPYMTLQMELFRKGERPSHIMNTLARSMTDRDIAVTVDYYATRPGCQ